MSPATVCTLVGAGTVRGVVARSGAACTHLLTLAVAPGVAKFLTVETSQGVGYIYCNWYSEVIGDVYIFGRSSCVKSENVSICTASPSRVRFYRYVGITNNPLRSEDVEDLLIRTATKLPAFDDAFTIVK